MGTLLREGPPDCRDALADGLLAILQENQAMAEGRPALYAMWQLYESLNVLPEPKREALVDRVLVMAQDLGAPRDGREVLDMLGLLLRHGPPSRKKTLTERLAKPLGDGETYAYERARAMTVLAEAMPFLAESEQKAITDRIIKEAWGRGGGQPVQGVYPEAVTEALSALWNHVPSRRDAILDFLLEATASGIYDLRCLALHALVEVAGALTPSRFETLVERAVEMARAPDDQARRAGRFALDRLSESGPEDRRSCVRARRQDVAKTPEALLDMPLQELVRSFTSVPEGERKTLYDRLVALSHDFVWSTYDPLSYEPSLDKHPREYEEDEQALLGRLFAIAPDSRRRAAFARLLSSLFGPIDKEVLTALVTVLGTLPPSLAEDITDQWPAFAGLLVDAAQPADPAVAAPLRNRLRESCRTLLETGPKGPSIALVLGAGAILFLEDHDDLPLARQLLEEAIRRCQSEGVVDPWDTRNRGILHGARLLLDQILWRLGETEAAK